MSKICPKCGREMEGNSCPYCDAPEITVNTSDYESRKRAYEEQLKTKDRSDLQNQNTAAEPDYAGNLLKQVQIKTANGTEKTREIASGLNSFKDKAFLFAKKNRKRMVITLAVLIVVFAAVKLVPALFSDRGTVYVLNDGKVYEVKNDTLTELAESKNVVTNVAADKTYVTQIPESAEKESEKEAYASSNGHYYAGVYYNTDSAEYKLYAWNGENSCLVVSGAGTINISDITNDGVILYTVTEVVNDEWAFGDTVAYAARLSGKSSLVADNMQITENLIQLNVYKNQNRAWALNSDGELIQIDSKHLKKSVLDTGVTALKTVTGSDTGVYTSTNLAASEDTDAKYIFYAKDGNWNRVNVKKNEAETLIKVHAESADLVYNESQNYLYEAGAEGIFGANLSGSGAAFERLDSLGSQSLVLFNSKEKAVIYADASGDLKQLKKTNSAVLDTEVKMATLSRVKYSKYGFTYMKHSDYCYMADSSSKAVVLDSSETSTALTAVLSGNHLYFKNGDSLVITDTRGSEKNSEYKAGRVW